MADLRTGAGKQPQMRRTCDKQKNIVTEVLSIVHGRVIFAYCIMLTVTKERTGLLKLDWASLLVTAILLCKFIVHSAGVKEVGVQPITLWTGFRIGHGVHKS